MAFTLSADFVRNLAADRAYLKQLHRSIDDANKAIRASRVACEESMRLLDESSK